jgi:hypothetical protein
MLSVTFLLSPTFLHRFGERTARRDRLVWSVRLMVIGLVLLAVSLVTALWAVSRFVFGDAVAWELVVPVGATMFVLWTILPFTLRRRGSLPAARRPDDVGRPRPDRADPS